MPCTRRKAKQKINNNNQCPYNCADRASDCLITIAYMLGFFVILHIVFLLLLVSRIHICRINQHTGRCNTNRCRQHQPQRTIVCIAGRAYDISYKGTSKKHNARQNIHAYCYRSKDCFFPSILL